MFAPQAHAGLSCHPQSTEMSSMATAIQTSRHRRKSSWVIIPSRRVAVTSQTIYFLVENSCEHSNRASIVCLRVIVDVWVGQAWSSTAGIAMRRASNPDAYLDNSPSPLSSPTKPQRGTSPLPRVCVPSGCCMLMFCAGC